MELHETVEMASELFDYFEPKVGKDKIVAFMSQYEMDNPHMLRTKTLEEWKRIGDKILQFRDLVNR